MVSEDRDDQAKRDAWVAEKLQELIDTGRADTLEDDQTYDPPTRRKDSRVTDGNAPRIDIP